MADETAPLDAIDLVVALIVSALALVPALGSIHGGFDDDIYAVLHYSVAALVLAVYTNWLWTRGGYGVVGACIVVNPCALYVLAAVNTCIDWIKA